MICLLSKIENEKIFGKKNLDQNGDRVSKCDKICQICIIKEKFKDIRINIFNSYFDFIGGSTRLIKDSIPDRRP